MLVYAVVSAATEKAVELSVSREDAEAFLEEVRADDAELAELLRLEPVELGRLAAPGASRCRYLERS